MDTIRKILFTILVVVITVPLAGNSGCRFKGFYPHALIGSADDFATEYPLDGWFPRLINPEPALDDGEEPTLIQDSASEYSLTVFSLGKIHGYRFQVGLDGEVDCRAEGAYSDWAPVSEPLQLSLGDAAGLFRLCILGRGIFDEGPYEQPIASATEYIWEKTKAGSDLPGAFEITAPAASVNGLSQTVQWTASEGATSYMLKVGKNSDCSTGLVANVELEAPATEHAVTLPQGGSFNVCLKAKNGGPETIAATNDGLGFAAVPISAVIVDHISNTGNWQGGVGGYSYWSGGIVDATTVAAFRGDGGKISKVGVLFGVFDRFGVPNAIDPTELDWAVTFYTSFDAFAANPFQVNDALPQTKVFNLPSNPDWLTVVGQTGISATIPGTGVHVRHAEFDVSSENWFTTPDALQGIAILPFNLTLGTTGFAHSNGVSAIGMELDWYFLKSGSNTWGPGPLSLANFPRPYASYRVETVR